MPIFSKDAPTLIWQIVHKCREIENFRRSDFLIISKKWKISNVEYANSVEKTENFDLDAEFWQPSQIEAEQLRGPGQLKVFTGATGHIRKENNRPPMATF